MRWPLLVLILIILPHNSFAIPRVKSKSTQNSQTILKADQIDGDQVRDVMIATGNVEITRDFSTIYADQVTYDKKHKNIHAIGHVKIKNFEVGNVLATEASMSDDFSKGSFINSRVFFSDGSYIFATKTNREDPLTTTFEKPVFSICPNDEISQDNTKAGFLRDFASIKSSRSTIDRKNNRIRSKHSILKIYSVPIFYTPYSSLALPGKDRHSGFLMPSYFRSTNFGLGLRTPFYVNIAPNIDLTVTPQFYTQNNQYLISNNFRHLTSYGSYGANLEIANNKITNTNNTTVINRTNDKHRGSLKGTGKFDFSTNLTSDFAIETLSDRDYLRDYHFNYWAYTLSRANLDYMHGRDYYSVKTLRVQELDDYTNRNAAPFVLPSLDYHTETKPTLSSKGKLAFTSNITNIYRRDGLEYRRATATPEANLPFNLKGNLFNLNAKMQGDFYWLENNFKNSTQTAEYQSTRTNYKPEASATWRLPLIKKANKNTLLIEPMANLVSSNYKKNFAKLPNEDSNNSELTISNLFVSDRIYGFDRNEAGERTSYGAKTSLFNQFGEFGLTIGQTYRLTNRAQDVLIRGFADNNRSDYVGQAMYKAAKYFTLTYSFQLNQANWHNDVNQVTTTLNTDRFLISADYLLLFKTLQNTQQREQLNLSSTIKMTSHWNTTITASKDLVSNRILSRGIILSRDGCCTNFSFSVIETNPINLTKPQRTFSLLFSFKNL
ncbi:MAG: LPS-assembly protein LptD [Alphaproteobacteria bacterium]|nr:LPS-assembly protein LptD [Alphaproteobacteria bacterium]